MKKQVASGELNQRISIMIPADTDDGAGGTIPGEVVYWQTSAKAEMLRSQKTIQANQDELKPTVQFTVRNRDDKFLNDDMVIIWRGERFNIMNAQVDYTYKEWVVITGKSVQLPSGQATPLPDELFVNGIFNDNGILNDNTIYDLT